MWLILDLAPSEQRFSSEDGFMRFQICFLVLLVIATTGISAFGQGKGVDSQNQRISDTGNNRGAANNGTKQDVGTTGSGINFGKDKTHTTTVLPNPYRLTARREALLKAETEVRRDRKLLCYK